MALIFPNPKAAVRIGMGEGNRLPCSLLIKGSATFHVGRNYTTAMFQVHGNYSGSRFWGSRFTVGEMKQCKNQRSSKDAQCARSFPHFSLSLGVLRAFARDRFFLIVGLFKPCAKARLTCGHAPAGRCKKSNPPARKLVSSALL